MSDNQVPQSRASLELAITEAVKAEPDCEAFVGVLVMPQEPKSRSDANWSIRGVKFGRANRDKSSKVLASIVERMQREFRLSEDSSAVTSATQSKPKICEVEISASGASERHGTTAKLEPIRRTSKRRRRRNSHKFRIRAATTDLSNSR